jgi:BNR repeat-containing family member/F5/8 type C domain/Concanavalin A-like lectin/glucanases superfamily/Bacterial TSP3 repeat
MRALILLPLVCLGAARAELRPAYSVDANTAYLFSFEESAGSLAATNSGSVGGQALAYTAAIYPGDNVAATASNQIISGASSYAGYGKAASLSTGNLGLGFDANADGGFMLDDNAPVSLDRRANHSSMLGTNNAFTIDALVNLQSALGGLREIVCTDDGDTNANRGFQFRFNGANLEFNWIGKPSGTTGVLVPVPSSGLDAFAVNTWFHVAVSYDGASLRFYWTKVDTARNQASLIATVASDIDPLDDMLLVLGNEARGVGGSSEGLLGLLDQVRISTVARGAGEFIFQAATVIPVTVSLKEASAWQEPNVPANTLDGNLGTRWSAQGAGQWITYDLATTALVNSLSIAFYAGDTRTSYFDLRTSFDNISWTPVLTNVSSSGATTALESFGIPASTYARYVRIVGQGNSASDWNSLTEVVIQASAVNDTDLDGLPDAWEQTYFGNLDQTASGDPDNDTLTNLQEYQLGTHPLQANNPADLDGDGLPDVWEQQYFGGLSQTAAGDPDGDGQTNAAELAAGSSPVNRASTAADTDADGLPDAWEQQYFSTLAYNAGDDPDGDHFANLQEYTAGTSPADAASRPPGTAVKIVPVDDGNPSTSEFGYAGSSAINSVAFVRCSLQTVGNQQFMTWYGRHQYDSAAAFNNTIWIGRRTLGSSHWEVFKHPSFTANTITDGHDVISFGIDGEGYMHLSWGMHGDAFHYSKTTTPVTGAGPIVLGPDTTMTGTENTVTYPQFLRLPDGDLLFIFREVASGNGDTYVNRYDIATHTWANVHGSTSTQSPFIKGTGWTPNYNAYLNMPQLGGPDGDDLILTWCWRFSSGTSDNPGSSAVGYQTNNRLNFARSPDAGLTWFRSTGTAYTLPITRNGEAGANSTAEVIHDIPENYSLINQASTCLDSAGYPVTASWWAPDTGATNFRRQYMVVFRHDNGTWQARAVSGRTTDPIGTRYAENHVRDLGRPTVVRDDADRIIVAYRDNQASNLTSADNSLNVGLSNGITIVHSLPRAEDPDRLLWISFDLTTENLGNYETMIDNELWDQKRQLHFLYQPAGGEGYTAPANTASRISVLEWDAADYFLHSPQPGIGTTADGTGLRIHWRSEPSFNYRLLTSTDLLNWTELETRPGTGAPFEYIHTLVPGEPKRFWRLDRAEGGF